MARWPCELARVLRLREVHHHVVVRVLEFVLWPAALRAIPDRRVEHGILELLPVDGVAFVQSGATGRTASARGRLLPATFVDVLEANLVHRLVIWQTELLGRRRTADRRHHERLGLLPDRLRRRNYQRIAVLVLRRSDLLRVLKIVELVQFTVEGHNFKFSDFNLINQMVCILSIHTICVQN